MSVLNLFGDTDFHPVIDLPETYKVFDFTSGYDPELIRKIKWGIGRYNERRRGMYTAPQYASRRYIHMGIDIWAPPGEPVFAVCDGEIVYMEDHDQRGNYGPVIVLKHEINRKEVFALHGHLSKESLPINQTGKKLKKGEEFARVGHPEENGEWEPHLHYQLSWQDPGEADMPGVVAEDELEKALGIYPDPRIVLGALY